MKSSSAPKDLNVSLSKKLSRALRHEAANMNIAITSEGYVSLTELMAHKDFKNVSVQDVKNVVYSTELKRFDIVIKDGNEHIRACQGHTIPSVNTVLLQKQFRENPNYDKSSNSVKNVSTSANNSSSVSSENDSSRPAVPAAVRPSASTATPAAPVAPATSVTPAAPKPNAWNTKAPVFVPSSAVLANLPPPISHLNKPVILMAPSAAPIAATSPVVVAAVEPAIPAVSKAPPVDVNLGITGPVDTIPSAVTMPTAGVWLRTALYEPKGTLGPEAEQQLTVLWVQAKSGHYVDLRVPPLTSSESEGATSVVQPHNGRVVKSFSGVASFDHSKAHQEWARRIDYRSVPAQDIGHIRLVSGGKQLVEDSALPEDDYREVWTRQIVGSGGGSGAKKNKEPAAAAAATIAAAVEGAEGAAAAADKVESSALAAPKKLWSSIVAPVATPATTAAASGETKTGDKKASAASSAAAESTDVSAVLTYRRKPSASSEAVDEVVGYFLQVEGYFALSINLRTVDLTDGGVAAPSGRRPTVAELKQYFSGATVTAASVAAPAAVSPVVAEEVVEVAAASAAASKPSFSYAAMTKKAVTATTPSATTAVASTPTSATGGPSTPLTDSQIEDFLTRYLTVVGNSNSWSILHALQASMVGRSVSTASFTHGSASVKLLDLLKKFRVNVVSGKLPKFLASVLKDVNATASGSAGDAAGKDQRNGKGRSSGGSSGNGSDRRKREGDQRREGARGGDKSNSHSSAAPGSRTSRGGGAAKETASSS